MTGSQNCRNWYLLLISGKLGTVQFGGVRLHIRGSGNIGRSVLEGTVQATVLMLSGNTASANAKIKFIQSKGGEYRMGKNDNYRMNSIIYRK